jgi:transposase
MTDRHARIAELRRLLSPEAMAARIRAAEEREALLRRVDARVRQGVSQMAARNEICPDQPKGALNRDLRLWRIWGLDGLIDTRRPPTTNGVPAIAHTLAVAVAMMHADWTAPDIAAHLEEHHGLAVAERSVRIWLRAAGIARRVGRPSGLQRVQSQEAEGAAPVPPVAAEQPVAVYRHAFAGAELLLCVDVIADGVPRLAEAVSAHARGLPVPGEPLDDRADRGPRGRFLAAYNRARPRRFAQLGSKFESSRFRAAIKNLRAMKIAETSPTTIARKLLALVMLPVAVNRDVGELDHGVSERFGRLVGYSYRSATLNKFKAELKFAEAANVLQRGWAELLRDEGEPVDPTTGAIMVFGDTTTRPLNTALYTRSLRVATKNRVMPGMSTVTLTNGGGSIVQYSVVSGTVAIHQALPALLDGYAVTFGPGTADRVLVVDREGHVRSFFESIGDRWRFIIALRGSVTGPNAEFRGQTAWVPRADGGLVCEAELFLRGKRKSDGMWVRVVGFRRHEEGSVLWFATNTPATPFAPAEVVRLYFQRWPCQELRFRDAKGRVGLQRHHGYGKSLPDKVVLVQRTDELKAEVAGLEDQLSDAQADAAWLKDQCAQTTYKVDRLSAEERVALGALREATAGPHDALMAAANDVTRLHAELQDAVAERTNRQDELARVGRTSGKLRADVDKRREEIATLSRRAEAFVVDHALDEVMMLPRALFLHATMSLQRDLLETKFETDTLIRRVLQLPGELHVGDGVRRVVIYRTPHDPEVDKALERAVERLAKRRPGLAISLADPPGDRIR